MIYTLLIPKGNDIEIAFVEGFCTKILSHSSNKKAKKIAWVHTDLINNHWITSVYKNKQEEKKSYQRYDKIIGVSNTATNAIKQLYNVNNAITLYNPIENDNIRKRANESIALPPKVQAVRMVTIGRFVPQKAYDRLLRVIKHLYEDGYSIELWILGDGEQRPILEEYINTYSLSKIVTLWGFQKNPYPYLKHSDIFVCSSISEGYSTAVNEALILQLPVITTACSGMDELLLNGKCGLITNNTEKDLYFGIKKCLDHSDILSTYKIQIKQRNKEFELSNRISQIENMFCS